ncbi:MAG TPA: sigma-70 family RNA polymerase sigma factor [Thermoanaerobaculia bacterium]|nr:sigma-70 family RNA polymerase sigma factor [Thermoanaerobaculia bacterium]
MSSAEPQPSDQELVAAVLAGDQEVFAELVRRYQGRLTNYLFRMLRNTDEAHDMAQEVFIKVYQALDRYDPSYRFSTWLFRVAQNSAIDQLRRRRHRELPIEPREGEDGEPRGRELASSDRGPYAHLRNRERGQAIQQAIDGLPWEYRELIVMRHFGELSYDEIARSKEMPLGTVKNKLFRARQMLKESLADFLTD